jgi:hypothetical protein
MASSASARSLAICAGLLHLHPEAKTIIQIGGQTSLVISLEDGLRKPWKVASNPLCAAGTGRFLEQQAYRIGITMDEACGPGFDLDRIFDFCAETGLVAILHSDVDMPFPKPGQEPYMVVQMRDDE